ncbi:YlaH-like protein [Lentibacillus halodurans]|uniref:YlaH-like protein n=1 Tax=Lentibacillus halodurans TaxID=237679 RepID=A0A1I0YZ16_9BACI|nr:YlaH-like family protein [Lentibacillus halodurans]SFB18287.1 YlaH-like protein [Lentibacillus halodurans]
MDTSFSVVYELIISYRDSLNVFWTFYVINLILAAIAYKLGFAKQLPVLKSVLVYILLAFGMLILNLFSIVGYPITDSLIVICLVLGIYRFRLHLQRKSQTS